jgi:hypothetical protein
VVFDDIEDIIEDDYVMEDDNNVEWNTNCWCMVVVCRLYW